MEDFDGDGFEDRTEAAGLLGQLGGINLTHADYNNDGFPDVYVMRGGWLREAGRHPNSLLRNNGDGTFRDVTEEAGLLSFHPTHTAAWGDVNNDGHLVRRSRQRWRSGCLRGDGRLVQRRRLSERTVRKPRPPPPLDHDSPGRHTLESDGARRAPESSGGGPRGPRDIYATVSSGGSYGSSPLEQQIGLGDATAIATVEVTWPVTGKSQVFRDVLMDQTVRIREGDPALKRESRKPFVLGGAARH